MMVVVVMKKRYIYSFLIPIAIVLISFLILGMYPFKDRSIILIDSNTQYVDFIIYFRSILLGLNNFKYTFSSTLGQNFIPLLGYYLMSPLNLLSIFFKPSNMKLFMTIIILIKIGLCGLTMEVYLSKTYKKVNILFSICYALMMYNIVYMYHLMWLDSIILFPLVILGIDNIFNKKSPLLYIVSLSLSIIFNYYIGFIICISSVIYFVYKYFLNRNSINKFKVFLEYMISSVLGGAISMFILLPSLLGLEGGKATLSLFNLTFDINISIFKVIAKMFTASTGAYETWHGGPMIGCSMLVLVLVILYFLNNKVNKKEKLFDGLLVLVFVFSFVFKDFDTLFHGFNTPNCFDFRHAFVLVFFLINIAIKSYINLDNKNYKKGLFILFIVSLLVYLCHFRFNVSTYNLTILISLFLGVVYIVLLSKNKKFIFYVLLIDLLLNTVSGILTDTMADKQFNSSFTKYVEEVSEVVSSIEDNSFYRMEKTFDRETNKSFLAINDSMIFNYNGISHFDSTSHEDVEVLMEQLGMRRLLTRAYYNEKGSTYFVDAMLGIKYVLSNDIYKNYKFINKVNDISIYENPYYLPLSYVISSDDIVLTKNPFVNQNNIAKSFTSLSLDIYNKANYNYVDNEYVVNITSTDELYFYSELYNSLDTNYGNAKIYVNDNYLCDYFTKYDSGVISLGKYNIGDIVRIRIDFENEIEYGDIDIYYEDMDVLEKHLSILRESDLEVVRKSSSNIVIKGDFKDNSKVFITIPYDKGFSVKVDGKSVSFNNSISLMSVDVPSGEHVIELDFTPRGLKIGVYLSILSVIFTIVYLVLREKLWNLYLKYQELCNYCIVGALTTLVSLVSYFILSRIFDISNNFYFILSNTISWILSVAFAYITNKKYVFNSDAKGIKEVIKFVSSRIATYLIDLFLMFIFVKVILINNDISKLIVQVVVFVLNYIFSKLLVFKK